MPLSRPTTPLNEQIQIRQAELGLTDRLLCEALGFEREIVLTLLKRGAMKMPLSKVPSLAAALGLDAAELLIAAIHESDPVLAQVIEKVFNPLRLTATDVDLLTHLRYQHGDHPGRTDGDEQPEAGALSVFTAAPKMQHETQQKAQD